MTENTVTFDQLPRSSVPEQFATAVLVHSDACPSIYNSGDESQNKSARAKGDTHRMGGKPRKNGPTRELLRLRWLIMQLERDGIGQAELARRTGMTTSYVNAIRNPDRGRNSGIGAEIVRQMKDGLGLSEKYFFDDYDGERPYAMYLLDAKREERRIDTLSEEQSSLRADFAQLRAELAERDAAHSRELAALEAELAQARKPVSSQIRGTASSSGSKAR
jgi:transcriptional regulator with XRE-family HTH domain